MTAPAAVGAEDQALLAEAVDWLVRFQAGENDDAQRAAFSRWQAQSDRHAAAWRRAEGLVAMFRAVPREIARPVLGRPRHARRQLVRALAAAAVAAPAAWLASTPVPLDEWLADVRTAPGERRDLALDDGTRLAVNTATAVDVRVRPSARVLRLHAGEILITTGHADAYVDAPFLVESTHGTVRAIGTRFLVRRLPGATRVAVYEGLVEVTPRHAAARYVAAGAAADFDAGAVRSETSADPAAVAWEHGMVVALDMRLADLVAELARYRRGSLQCDPAVAGLRVTGAFPSGDIDRSLTLLERTLPVRIRSVPGDTQVVSARGG